MISSSLESLLYQLLQQCSLSHGILGSMERFLRLLLWLLD